MRPTPRQVQHFGVVFMNLLGGAILLRFATLDEEIRSLASTSLVVLLILVVDLLLYAAAKHVKSYRSPVCPVCGSSDVSFGGRARDDGFLKSPVAFILVVSILLSVLGSLPWTRALFTPLVRLNPYLSAAVIFVYAVSSSVVLTVSFQRRKERNPESVIRWQCENCKNIWDAQEAESLVKP